MGRAAVRGRGVVRTRRGGETFAVTVQFRLDPAAGGEGLERFHALLALLGVDLSTPGSAAERPATGGEDASAE